MMPVDIILQWTGLACVFAFLVSLGVSGFAARGRLIDIPVGRSSHNVPTPTAGGIGLIAGIGAGLLALTFIFPHMPYARPLAQMGALIMAVAALGLLDDCTDISAKIKLLIMLVLSLAAVWVSGAPIGLPMFGDVAILPPALAFAGAVLWVFVVTNAVNFFDGINGIMGLCMIIANFGIVILSLQTGALVPLVLSGLCVAALLGFLPYNFKTKADVFAGDVGALPLGFIFAVSGLFLVNGPRNAHLLYALPILILPILADIFMTLLVRARRRNALMAAHRDHLYQRATARGFTHVRVSFTYGYLSLICLAITLAAEQKSWIGMLWFLAIMVALAVLNYGLVYRRWRAP